MRNALHSHSHDDLLDGFFVAAVALTGLLCFLAVLFGLS
jgi:methylphosphotriester-DNA--protein-cysteine methyltransferase